MIRLLILLLLAMLPLYLCWRRHVRRCRVACEAGETPPCFKDEPWQKPLLIGLALAILGFFALGLFNQPTGGHYSPPHLENGQMVPGRVLP